MNILDTITTQKQAEVSARKRLVPQSLLEQAPLYTRKTVSLAAALRSARSGIIAEHKRRSPSKSVINETAMVQEVIKGYEQAGAAGISILTDTPFFGGSLTDLAVARATTQLPLLRKEFIIDAYQIYEAKAFGADAILLIAACLTDSQLRDFSQLAHGLGLEVLLEVHDATELRRSLLPNISMLGVNNRSLKTFETSLETSRLLATAIPDGYVKVSESGISSVSAIEDLKTYGYQGFLIGETFMKTQHPGSAASEFINLLP